MSYLEDWENCVAGRSWNPGKMAKSITLDHYAVAATWQWPQPFGGLSRILLAIVIGSNRYEPMPAGGNWDRWPDRRPWIRWILWHIRNFCEDLRKFYLGFGYAQQADPIQVTKHFRIWMARFERLPWRLPFPYYKYSNSWIEIMIGWKSRGIVSVTIRR